MSAVDSPLLRTAELGATDVWNDSCAVTELEYAVARGATGATSNPPIVLDVFKKEREFWAPRVREIAAANPDWTEVELTWALIEAMVVRGAGALAAIHERTGGHKGWLSVQVDPANYTAADRMVEQALRLSNLAPNLQVKFPVTRAGIVAIEDATARGVTINATVSFSVSQAIAAAQAVERGLDRLAASGGDPSRLAPTVVIMVGRLDDWMKAVVSRDGLTVDPAALDWAGIAAFKRAYGIFREKGLRSRLLAAAYRHHLHWTEFVGGDVILTIPYAWQVRFNASGIDPVPRIQAAVDPALIRELTVKIPDFARAYEPDGLGISEFEHYGAASRTLRGFIAAYHDLHGQVRDLVLPNPDVKA